MPEATAPDLGEEQSLAEELAALERRRTALKEREAAKQRQAMEAELQQLRDSLDGLEEISRAELQNLQAQVKKTEEEIEQGPEARLKRLKMSIHVLVLSGGSKSLVRARQRVKELEKLLEPPPEEQPQQHFIVGPAQGLEALR